MIKLQYIQRWQVYAVFIMLAIACGRQTEQSGTVFVPKKIDFNFHVRPILSDRCFACHGPDEKARESDLRLDLADHAFAPIDSLEGRYAIVPGDLRRSELVQRIHESDPELMMPPPSSNLKLAPHEKEILARWIEQGAEWKEHWAFEPPTAVEPPRVSGRNVSNPIDQFIAKKLKEKGLKPNPNASKEKLIRRLSFDLRGLPPTLEEINTFIQDGREDAYEQLIDRFMGDQSFGERMAMEWLDLARYADSHGYQDDLERSMWPWRDWVIEAFNNNLPYDQFVSWQLAGDLMEDATYEQKLATGFNRNHKITQEVGVVNEEYRVTYVLDRVNTFSTAFLGLTVECAQCHDHKYDPISQKEYYELFSFFNNVPEKGRVDYGVEVAEPYLPLPEDRVEEVRKYVENLLDDQREEVIQYMEKKWAEGYAPSKLNDDLPENPLFPSGLQAWFPLDYVENNEFYDVRSDLASTAVNDLLPVQGKYSGAVQFTGTNYGVFNLLQPINLNSAFTISFWVESMDGGIRGPVISAIDHRGNSNFLIKISNNKDINVYLGNKARERGIYFTTKSTVPENKWTLITVTYDGSKRNRGLKLFMDGVYQERYEYDDDLVGTMIPSVSDLFLGAKQALTLKEIKDQRSYFSGEVKGLESGRLDEFMFFNRTLSASEVSRLYQWNPIVDLLSQTHHSPRDQKRLFFNDLFQSDPIFRMLTDRFREFKIRKVRTHDIVIRPTMVMQDMDTTRSTYILERGQYDAPTEEVFASTPEIVGEFPENFEANRLGLARWLFSKDHPLTARVAVNRYWQMIFGRGIVATAGDFGSQGALPTYPKLLDWLAVKFMEDGWDVKKLLRLMVTTSAYQRSVALTRELERKDPDNLYLARGPQVRLPAEMIRDHALAASGLLDRRIGGPSVKPYQPEGLWLEVASGNQSLRKYIQDHNEDLYRRSLYTFWKRTIPPPNMTIFDAPSREQCIIRRTPTSTPMQALVLLNDPQFVEASKLIAARMMDDGGETLQDRISYAFRLLTSRLPTQREVDILADLYQMEMESYQVQLESANDLLSIGEASIPTQEDAARVAALTLVANAILNTTESILKG